MTLSTYTFPASTRDIHLEGGTEDAAIHALLDSLTFGELLFVEYANARHSLASAVCGPVLGDQGLSPAVCIDLFNGAPLVVRDDLGNLDHGLISAARVLPPSEHSD